MKDFELLKNLYEIHSPSYGEKRMRKFVRRIAMERGGQCQTDNFGNLYVTKGVSDTYPCICAHLDQVQDNHSKDFTVFLESDIIFAFSPKSKSQQGLGADDKNGIWIALELLKQLDVLKCAFFVGEEVGCNGSSKADMGFFSNVRFCIEPDRRNGSDLITDITGDICSKDFLNAIGYEKFGYKPTTGMMTDVMELCDSGIGVSCINISCGYYHPHTDNEVTCWSELCNAHDFALHICKTLTDVYPHTYTYEAYNYYKNWSNWNGYDYGETGYDPLKYYKRKSPSQIFDESADKEIMAEILREEPHLTFEEVQKNYGDLFLTKNDSTLKQMYSVCLDRIMEQTFTNSDSEAIQSEIQFP